MGHSPSAPPHRRNASITDEAPLNDASAVAAAVAPTVAQNTATGTNRTTISALSEAGGDLPNVGGLPVTAAPTILTQWARPSPVNRRPCREGRRRKPRAERRCCFPGKTSSWSWCSFRRGRRRCRSPSHRRFLPAPRYLLGCLLLSPLRAVCTFFAYPVDVDFLEWNERRGGKFVLTPTSQLWGTCLVPRGFCAKYAPRVMVRAQLTPRALQKSQPPYDSLPPFARAVGQDIPKLVFRTSGELHIVFSTGHVQIISLRGEVGVLRALRAVSKEAVC